jgi:hypothetical protein
MIKENILICSIFRDQQANLKLYTDQLTKLINLVVNKYNIYISWYENDSKDLTSIQLNEIKSYFRNHTKIKDIFYTSEQLNTKKYGSVWNTERIINLSNARNKAVFQGINNYFFDKIVFIEPDIKYDANWCKELILAEHPNQAGINPDIYSAWSLRSENHPKESFYLYDTCACRQNENDTCWNFNNENQWINESLIKTDFGGPDGNCLHRIYSTFNCFCVYNAKPFYNGVSFGYTNTRINPSNIKINNEWLDSDTVNIVEKFREKGYNNVLVNRNCIVRHL